MLNFYVWSQWSINPRILIFTFCFKPVIEDISLNVVYPRHTGMKPSHYDNSSGDIAVPKEVILHGQSGAKNLSRLDVNFNDTSICFNLVVNKQLFF